MLDVSCVLCIIIYILKRKNDHQFTAADYCLVFHGIHFVCILCLACIKIFIVVYYSYY